jgi:ABC-type transporter Mla subunit MlaD
MPEACFVKRVRPETMVDSRAAGGMMAKARRDSGSLEQKVDALSDSVARLAATTDARFEQVDARFEQVDARFEQVDARFDQVDRRLDQVDLRLGHVDRRLDQIGQQLQSFDLAFAEQRGYTDSACQQLVDRMDSGFARLERKIDQMLDMHLALAGRLARKPRR